MWKVANSRKSMQQDRNKGYKDVDKIKGNKMKNKYFLLLIFLLAFVAIRAQEPSAILHLESTDEGVLIPRMTEAQRDAIVEKAEGMLIYQTTAPTGFYFYTDATWQLLRHKGETNIWQENGSAVYYNVGRVGIGKTNPLAALDVAEDIQIDNVYVGRGSGSIISNTILGNQALNSNTSGARNSAVGFKGLTANEDGSDNSSFGYQALKTNSTGSGNTASGSNSMLFNTIGQQNTASGLSSLSGNTEGDLNTAHGAYALSSNQLGSKNTAVGSRALLSNDLGSNNVAIGHATLYHTTNKSGLVAVGDSAMFNNGLGIAVPWQGVRNVAVGSKSMYSNTSGTFNVAIGAEALFNNTDKFENVAVGDQSLYKNGLNSTLPGHASKNTAVGTKAMFNNTTGYLNSALGSFALFTNTTGHCNTAMGFNSLYNNEDGNFNTSIGHQSSLSNESGTFNTAVGHWSFYSNTSGDNNVAAGHGALFFNQTGSSNTALGTEALYSNTAGSNNTAVGQWALYDGDSLSNSVGIGYFANPNASNTIRLGNTATSEIGGFAGWTVLSDGRFKINAKEDIPGLAFIRHLRPVTYQLDMGSLASFLGTPDSMRLHQAEQKKSEIRYSGFLAQEVEQAANALQFDFSGVKPPAHEGDHYGLRYAEFVVPLVKAVQELATTNERLQSELEAERRSNRSKQMLLQKRLEQIESQLTLLQSK